MWFYGANYKRYPITYTDSYRNYSKFNFYNIEATYHWSPSSYRRDKHE